MSDDMDLPGMPEPCRLGRVEYDGARYCHEHGGFLEPGIQSLLCDRAVPGCASHWPCCRCPHERHAKS